MIITFAGIPLGDDASGKHIADYDPGFSLLTESVDFIGTANGGAFPRGNRRFSPSFKVSRAEASPSAALDLAHSHPKLLPNSGVLEVSQSVTPWRGANAVLNGVRVVLISGCRVEFEYEFLCSTMTLGEASEDIMRDVDFRIPGDAASGTVVGGAPTLLPEDEMGSVEDAA